MRHLESAILQTMAYAAVFSYPLTSDQVWRYLIADKPHTLANVEAGLNSLVRKGLLLQVDELYLPPGQRSWAAQRHRRETASDRKWQRGCKVARILAYIPSVYGVYLTGAVAMSNAEVDDDIDLLIVTRAHALWSTRLVVTSLLHLMGVRRLPGEHKVKDRLCTNMYLDEAALSVPEKKRSLYSAHEVVQAQFVAGDDSVRQRFLDHNVWVDDFLPHGLGGSRKHHLLVGRWRQVLSIPFTWPNVMAYRFQRWYMRQRMTRETVGLHMAYFHPRDTATRTQQSYEWWCKKFGV